MLLSVYNAAAFTCRRTDTVAILWSSAFGRPAFSAVKCWVRRKASSTDVAMVRVLNVAEKNDAAKSLSDIMSAGRYTKVIVYSFRLQGRIYGSKGCLRDANIRSSDVYTYL